MERRGVNLMMVIDPNCPEWKEKVHRDYDSCYDCPSCYECAFNMSHFGSIDGPVDPCEGCPHNDGECSECCLVPYDEF